MDSWFYQDARTEDIITKYGEIGNWDVSRVRKMRFLFYNKNDPGTEVPTEFELAIAKWDVSAAEDMTGMFCKMGDFNGPIGSWGSKTARVQKMDRMFEDAAVFNKDISAWNVGSVESMARTGSSSKMHARAESDGGSTSRAS